MIKVLIADDMEQVAEAVAAAVDDIEAVARKVIGIESANDDADDDTYGHQ